MVQSPVIPMLMSELLTGLFGESTHPTVFGRWASQTRCSPFFT